MEEGGREWLDAQTTSDISAWIDCADRGICLCLQNLNVLMLGAKDGKGGFFPEGIAGRINTPEGFDVLAEGLDDFEGKAEAKQVGPPLLSRLPSVTPCASEMSLTHITDQACHQGRFHRYQGATLSSRQVSGMQLPTWCTCLRASMSLPALLQRQLARMLESMPVGGTVSQ